MSFFKSRSNSSQGGDVRGTVPAESVETLRRRARHRLVGAAVLVLLGVIGFPLLFDTQPRPVNVDIPIEIPDRTKTPALTVPPASTGTASHERAASASGRLSAAADGIITERADGSEVSTAPVAAQPAAKVEPKPEPKPDPKPDLKPEPKVESKPEPKPPVTKPAARDDGTRAKALLEGKPTDAKPTENKSTDGDERFIVQVGAFADVEKAREVRRALEKAGLKTYTHVAKTPDGERTRVRVGPFESRAEAERAAQRAKSLSLQAAVLKL